MPARSHQHHELDCERVYCETASGNMAVVQRRVSASGGAFRETDVRLHRTEACPPYVSQKPGKGLHHGYRAIDFRAVGIFCRCSHFRLPL
jgi:hypothetical protein